MNNALINSDKTKLVSTTKTPKYLVAISLFSTVFVLIPVIYLLIRSSENGISSFIDLLGRPKTLQTLFTSLTLSLVVAVGSLTLGLFVASTLAKTNIYLKRFFLILMPLPLAIPSYVIAYSYLAIFPFLQGFWISAFILSVATFPFVAIPTYSILRKININQEEVARTLGLTPLKVFLKIIWPQIKNVSFAGALLSALYALAEFGTVSFMRLDTFTRVIYTTYRAAFDRSTAASLAIMLLALSLIVVYTEKKSRGQIVLTNSGGKTGSLFDLKRYRFLSSFFLFGLNLLCLGIPGYVLISRTIDLGVDIDLIQLLSTTWNTASVAFIGASLSIIFAVPIGILISRFKSKLATSLENIFLITHAIPGVIIGLALVAIGSRFLSGIYQTLYLLAIAYSILFIANSLGTIRNNLEKIPVKFEEISRTLGQNYFQSLRRIVLPIAAPGILSGWLLVFVSAMKELPATLMLRPTGFETLATSIWTQTSISQFAQAAPFALALICVASIPSYLINRPNVAETSIMRDNIKYD